MLEARDTVMTIEQMNKAILDNTDLPMGQAIAKVQAEISFKMGIKEMVKWIMGLNRAGGNYYHDGKWLKTFEFQIPLDEWETKLKDWFKDNPEITKEDK